MNVNHMLRRQIFFWIGAVFCVFLFVNHPFAETENTETKAKYVIKKSFNNPKQYETDATVMEIHKDDFYIVIAENYYYVATFKINGKTQETVLLDAYGKGIEMDDFIIGERVKATSIVLDAAKGQYVALKIEKVSP